MTRIRILGTAFLAAAILGAMVVSAGQLIPATRSVGNLTITEAAWAASSPSVPADAAQRAGLARLSSLDAAHGRVQRSYTVTSTIFASSLHSASDTTANLRFDAGTPFDAWVISASAPGDAQWKHITALIIVDAGNGKVRGIEVGLSN
jgi:hypothetical protein